MTRTITIKITPAVQSAIDACTETETRYQGDRVKQLLALATDERVLPFLIEEAKKRGWISGKGKP